KTTASAAKNRSKSISLTLVPVTCDGRLTNEVERRHPDTRPARRERNIVKRARGTAPPTCHGPLQAMLNRLFADDECPNRAFARNGAVMHDSLFLLSSTTAGR